MLTRLEGDFARVGYQFVLNQVPERREALHDEMLRRRPDLWRVLFNAFPTDRRGEVPPHPPIGMQIPTVMDPSLAPAGFHIATTYGFFFPCEAPKEERGRLRDTRGQRVGGRGLNFSGCHRANVVDGRPLGNFAPHAPWRPPLPAAGRRSATPAAVVTPYLSLSW